MTAALRSAALQASLLVLFAIAAGLVRQAAPEGIAWNGRWPASSTSAEDAYKMVARPGDPAFVSLDEMIRIQEKRSAVILDARASNEYAAGRIPGARSLPYYEMDSHRSALAGVTAGQPIVIYCEGVGCELSFLLGRELQSGGFRNVRIFYGGFPEWKNAGLPVEK